MTPTLTNPYRSRALAQHVPAVPMHKDWVLYKWGTAVYNVLLWAAVLFFAGLVVFDPISSIMAAATLPLPFISLWLGVRGFECPICHESIVAGPIQISYTRSLLGLFPRYCTSCGADVPDGPTQPPCDCAACAER